MLTYKDIGDEMDAGALECKYSHAEICIKGGPDQQIAAKEIICLKARVVCGISGASTMAGAREWARRNPGEKQDGWTQTDYSITCCTRPHVMKLHVIGASAVTPHRRYADGLLRGMTKGVVGLYPCEDICTDWGDVGKESM